MKISISLHGEILNDIDMKKHIPNLITLMNAISGALAVGMAMYGELSLAAICILAGMVFDFFDGMVARLLHVKSELGKELDSLADVLSFGIAPAVLAHCLIVEVLPGGDIGYWKEWGWEERLLALLPLLIPAFSVYRLAKFNLDVRQTMSFIGMPVPAHALFWIGLVWGKNWSPDLYGALFGNAWVLGICVVILSLLLVSELPMFSLKVTGLGWQGNKIRYIYFLVLVLFACFLGRSVVFFVIPLYILFALVAFFSSLSRQQDHNQHSHNQVK